MIRMHSANLYVDNVVPCHFNNSKSRFPVGLSGCGYAARFVFRLRFTCDATDTSCATDRRNTQPISNCRYYCRAMRGRQGVRAYGVKGFTLLEVLIATSIIAIVAMSLYSAFHTGVLSYKKIGASFEVYQSARSILNRMELDLSNAFGYSDEDSKFSGQKETLDFFSVIDSYSGIKKYSNVCRIKYEVKNKILNRSCFTDLKALTAGAEPVTEEFPFGVSEISFEYAFDLNIATGAYEWFGAWPKEKNEKGPLPLAVKIKLVFTESTKAQTPLEFIKIIPLPLSEKIKPR